MNQRRQKLSLSIKTVRVLASQSDDGQARGLRYTKPTNPTNDFKNGVLMCQ